MSTRSNPGAFSIHKIPRDKVTVTYRSPKPGTVVRIHLPLSNRRDGMIYKRCSRCGSRVPAGTTCPCRKNNIREYAKPTGIKKEYHAQRWKNLRQFVLNSYDGLDIYILYKYNRIVTADTVHHIELSQDRPDLFYSDSNLIPVSRAGHKEIHKRYEKEGKTVVQEELRGFQMRFKTTGG